MYVSIVGVVLDTLLWFFVLVPPFLVLWVVVRLGFGLARAPPPPWARTPLDFVIRVYLLAHRVRVIDAEPKGVFEAATVESVANWLYESTSKPREVKQKVYFRLEDYQYNWR